MADGDSTRGKTVRRIFAPRDGDLVEILSRLLTILVLIYFSFYLLGYGLVQVGVGMDPTIGFGLASVGVIGGLYLYYRRH